MQKEDKIVNFFLILIVVGVFLLILVAVPTLMLKKGISFAPPWNPSKGNIGESVVPGGVGKYSCPRTLYTIGDPYIGEDKNNPDWVWLLDNLEDHTYATDIEQPNLITGPVLGVENAFEGNDLTDEHLLKKSNWVERLGWSLPNDYMRLFYLGTEDYDSLEEGPWSKPKMEIKRLDFDTTQATNVPRGLKLYLKQNAKVIKISTENLENIPSLIFDDKRQIKYNKVGEPIDSGFGGEWQDENNYFYYQASLSNVLSDGSIDVEFYKFALENGDFSIVYLGTRNIPLQTHTIFQGVNTNMTFYNYFSRYYEDGYHLPESAIVYAYEWSTSKTQVGPTQIIYLQPINFNNRTLQFLPFYIDYYTGDLVYIKNINNPNQGHEFANVDYRYLYSYDRISITYDLYDSMFGGFGENELLVSYYLYVPYWPRVGQISSVNQN